MVCRWMSIHILPGCLCFVVGDGDDNRKQVVIFWQEIQMASAKACPCLKAIESIQFVECYESANICHMIVGRRPSHQDIEILADTAQEGGGIESIHQSIWDITGRLAASFLAVEHFKKTYDSTLRFRWN